MIEKFKWSKIKSKIHRLIHGFDSGGYWENRYASGGNSGAGSYNLLAEFKAEVINNFIEQHKVTEVVEWGFGDCNQLKLFRCPKFTGVDVSKTAVAHAQETYIEDSSKAFYHTSEFNARPDFDLSLSLDVIYHLIEDVVFHKYMENLFNSSSKWVIIYASNKQAEYVDGFHVKHRKFSEWIEINRPNWTLLEHIPNKFPWDENDPDNTSFADFYIYEKLEGHSTP